MVHRSCPECGARIADDAERCDLCGASLEAGTTEDGGVPGPATSDVDGVYCNSCGAKNPRGSNFCSRCGTKLQWAAAASAPPAGDRSGAASQVEGKPRRTAKSDSRLTRHVGMLIGLAVLVVVALYMITVMSSQRTQTPSTEAVLAPAEAQAASIIQEREAMPIAEVYREHQDSLLQVIEDGSATEVVSTRRRLVDFYIGIGRIDRAAIEQQRVARMTEQTADWKKAGNLLFDWMETSEPEVKSQVALLTIDAYRQLLQQEPDDLDARADLGWAYQYDPQNPMEAIRQTNLVLDEDPDHLTANYNKGVFLLRINRLDEAVNQFERVKSIAGAESPYHRQAQMWIETIQESQAQREAS